MENTETCILGYCLRGLRFISKIFITMKASLRVPLLDLCLVTIATQLSKILQFFFIRNVFWKWDFTTESVFWYQVNTKTGPLNNFESQLDMMPWVPLGHCFALNVDIAKRFIRNIKFLTSHFPETMQHNFILKSP